MGGCLEARIEGPGPKFGELSLGCETLAFDEKFLRGKESLLSLGSCS